VKLWEPRRKIELQYEKALRRLLNRIWRDIKFLDDPFDIVDVFERVGESQVFESFANTLASNMITATLFDTGRNWREAAKEGTKSRLIHQLLKNELQGPVGVAVNKQIKENAYYIRSMPLDFAERSTKYIAEQQQAGRRASDIAKNLLEMYPKMSDSKARLIARTETSKASSALTQARAENLGLNAYHWRTSEDQRVRSSHRHMDDVVVFYNDPPDPEKIIGAKSYGKYQAGNIFNCRCYQEPIIDIDLLPSSFKVYTKGKIIKMNKKQFKGMV
jgi:SPP1 gp7 family putative phage head morphogenesis protein